MSVARKPAAQRLTEKVLIKLRPLERAAVAQVAEQEQTTVSAVARRAIVRDLKRRGKESE